MTIENFGLLYAVYPKGTLKIRSNDLMHAKLPSMCPNCLKPGNTQEHFPLTVGIWRVTIPISTHFECKKGWRKNISGSVRVWAETDYLCFSFREPLYHMLFSRINFPVIRGGNNQPLKTLYDREIRRRQTSFKPQATCPRCQNGVMKTDTHCSSCGYELALGPWSLNLSRETSTISLDVQLIRTCPSCGIMMLQEKKVQKCGRCGEKLTKPKRVAETTS